MTSKESYIQCSLQYHLFWIRILKEHAIFIEATMPPPGKEYADQADTYKQQYDQLLEVAIKLSNGVIPLSVLESGQFYTQYTEEAERLAQLNTGITINSQLTRMTYDIIPCTADYTATNRNEQDVFMLNQNLLNLTTSFVQFQADLLNKRVSCGLFTMMYTADILHILMEAKRYLEILKRLQSRDDSLLSDYKSFWSHNMADHAKVMRGQLDPTETSYFNAANQFANTFDLLSTAEANPDTFPTDREILSDAIAISDFKSDTTSGLITCKIQAIMLALYTDHLLREANHFIYLMYAGS
ncbi:DUF2935 domain-containing protein [Lacrimispora defluvii]|uniref:DUF2935 domain-containing protein n=1 Tax=Lacrimispora defluvii TaxID=2719233 RepID=A0ABX1VNB1_9FIRM|nr:DUF2935 domain-containing protein [Lacrimispora defluvii]NNJ29905.1 DUF2935 domain-containing protein [Lacrimispora defluvii]